MEVEVHRKLVLTYRPGEAKKYPNLEMKFSMKGPDSADYTKFAEEICLILNEEIAKIIDHARFHIVEVKIIK